MVTVCESLGCATAGEFFGVALLLVYISFDVSFLHLYILHSKLVFYSISAEMNERVVYSRCELFNFLLLCTCYYPIPASDASVLQLKALDGYWATTGDVSGVVLLLYASHLALILCFYMYLSCFRS